MMTDAQWLFVERLRIERLRFALSRLILWAKIDDATHKICAAALNGDDELRKVAEKAHEEKAVSASPNGAAQEESSDDRKDHPGA